MSIFHGRDKHTVQELIDHLEGSIAKAKEAAKQYVDSEFESSVALNMRRVTAYREIINGVLDYFNDNSDGPGGSICNEAPGEDCAAHPMTPENQVPVSVDLEGVIVTTVENGEMVDRYVPPNTGDWSDS